MDMIPLNTSSSILRPATLFKWVVESFCADLTDSVSAVQNRACVRLCEVKLWVLSWLAWMIQCCSVMARLLRIIGTRYFERKWRG